MGNGKMENGKWEMENGKWENEEWEIKNERINLFFFDLLFDMGYLTFFSGDYRFVRTKKNYPLWN